MSGGFLVADANDDGLPVLNGRRTTTASAEEAAEVAGETHGQVFALEPVEADPPFPPIAVVDVRATELGAWLGGVR